MEKHITRILGKITHAEIELNSHDQIGLCLEFEQRGKRGVSTFTPDPKPEEIKDLLTLAQVDRLSGLLNLPVEFEIYTKEGTFKSFRILTEVL